MDLSSPLRGLLQTFVQNLPVGYAFGAGVLASVSVCGFPLLVAYVGYYLEGGERRLLRALGLGLLATLGFAVLFSVAGIVLHYAGQSLTQAFPWLGVVAGVGLIGVGIWHLRGKLLGFTSPLQLPKGRGPLAFFLFGLVYGVVSLGCSLPIFLVLVGWAFSSQGAVGGLREFISYGLGMGSVIVVVSLASALAKEAIIRRLRSLLPWMRWITGLVLIVAGVYIVYQEVSYAL
ncbi:MAG: cytochrome c biogenesis CcdA family protein [Chloroflexi bacterium]|nr:cytochrome c biogenesis CcdA family protein [Chloroflexota bacterium]